EDHPHTAHSYHNVASCLQALGKLSEAFPLSRQALEIKRQALGAGPPATATGSHNVASCLKALGQPAGAVPPARTALLVRRQGLGEDHPHTAHSYHNVASCLNALGKREEATRHLRLALLGLDVGRHSAAPAGFDRSLFAATQGQPRLLLAGRLAA